LSRGPTHWGDAKPAHQCTQKPPAAAASKNQPTGEPTGELTGAYWSAGYDDYSDEDEQKDNNYDDYYYDNDNDDGNDEEKDEYYYDNDDSNDDKGDKVYRGTGVRAFMDDMGSYSSTYFQDQKLQTGRDVGSSSTSFFKDQKQGSPKLQVGGPYFNSQESVSYFHTQQSGSMRSGFMRMQADVKSLSYFGNQEASGSLSMPPDASARSGTSTQAHAQEQAPNNQPTRHRVWWW